MRLAYVVSAQATRFAPVASERDIKGFLRRLSALGFDGTELAIRDPSLSEASEIVELAACLGLAVPAIGTGQAYLEDGLSLAAPEAAVREHTVARLANHTAVARRAGALLIVGLIHGPIPPGERRETALERLLSGLGQVARAARAQGVRIVIEPINRYESNWLNTVDEVMGLLARLGEENVGILPDTFHMNIEEDDPLAALRRAQSRLWHVHIADSNRRAPGRGHVDFKAVVATLGALDYRGFLSAEVLQEPTPDAAAQQTLEAMRELIARA